MAARDAVKRVPEITRNHCPNPAKCAICAQTLTESVSGAQVARRYSMNANLIFKWLKDPRFAPVEGGISTDDAVVESIFLPIEIDAPPLESADPARDMRDPPLLRQRAARGHHAVG